MFLTLSKTQDTRLPNHDWLGKWCLSTDNGWTKNILKDSTTVYFKGISNNRLSINVDNKSEIISFDHGNHRSFPLWWEYQSQTLTNMLGNGQLIRADKKVSVMGDQLLIENRDIHGDIDITSLSKNDVIDGIVQELKKEFMIKFEQNTKLYISGGIDTVTLLAFSKSLAPYKYDIITEQYFENDEFCDKYIEKIRDHHWGYKQIHFWNDSPTRLLSGAYGDEYMMRGPQTVALWCAWQGIDIVSIFKKVSGYNINYYLKPQNLKFFTNSWQCRDTIQKLYPTYQDLCRQILDINANDHQHWHLGNTLTWTPFLNNKLTKLMLRLNPDDLVQQILDAEINRGIIRLLAPEVEQVLSNSKNFNSTENVSLLSNII
jgi:hypothetical protein